MADSQERPGAGGGRSLTRPEFDEFIRRATELAARESDGGEGALEEAELLRIAREVGLPERHVRWFRVMAAAQVLADRDITTLQAAHRLGFTTGGNFCRAIKSVTGFNSSEVRGVQGWNRLLVTFVWRHLGKAAIEQWATLDDLFVRKAA
ncbi:MAG: hypothetical protein EXR95_09685 [Gemmatimonadetes bacterium]|nr:hypothetical protein [Gemmatimonadota bacterium]